VLRKTKTTSRKQYCNTTTMLNHWKAVYKLESGNLKHSSTLSTLRKPDGTDTKNLAETIHYVRDLHT
jgi:hypothetical protein